MDTIKIKEEQEILEQLESVKGMKVDVIKGDLTVLKCDITRLNSVFEACNSAVCIRFLIYEVRLVDIYNNIIYLKRS